MKRDAKLKTRNTQLSRRKGSSVHPRKIFLYINVLAFSPLQILLFSFSPPPSKDLHLPFIFTHRLSSRYIWRVEIAFLGLLSHPKHTGQLLSYNLSCITTVHGHFLINVAREVVVSHLMRRGQLPLPSLLTLLITCAKSTLVLL